jgi:hypothetical protein
MVKVRTVRQPRVAQGDIYKDIDFIEYVAEKSGRVEISKIRFPLVMVLTQDCDLEQDYVLRWSRKPPASQDKWLLSALVAPLYNAEHVYLGEHLEDVGLHMQTINKKKSPGNYLRNNELPRYHFLEFPPEIHIVPSVIDFKHYFSVNVQHLKKIRKAQFVCNVPPLFREDITQRFSSFLSRIGLPTG